MTLEHGSGPAVQVSPQHTGHSNSYASLEIQSGLAHKLWYPSLDVEREGLEYVFRRDGRFAPHGLSVFPTANQEAKEVRVAKLPERGAPARL